MPILILGKSIYGYLFLNNNKINFVMNLFYVNIIISQLFHIFSPIGPWNTIYYILKSTKNHLQNWKSKNFSYIILKVSSATKSLKHFVARPIHSWLRVWNQISTLFLYHLFISYYRLITLGTSHKTEDHLCGYCAIILLHYDDNNECYTPVVVDIVLYIPTTVILIKMYPRPRTVSPIISSQYFILRIRFRWKTQN